MRRILEFIKPHYAKMAVGLSIKFIGTVMERFLLPNMLMRLLMHMVWQ